ncbi:MAG: hypothetical protein V4526_03010 [Patescibacteria group bacterium]
MDLKDLLKAVNESEAQAIKAVQASFAMVRAKVEEQIEQQKWQKNQKVFGAFKPPTSVAPQQETLVTLIPDFFPSLDEVKGPARGHLKRALQLCEVASIRTVVQLVMKTEQELLKYRNTGKKTIQFIQFYLGQRGLSLAMNLDTSELDKKYWPPLEELFSGIPDQRKKTLVDALQRGTRLKLPSSRWGIDVDVRCTGDLLVRTRTHILQIPGLAKCDVNLIERRLAKHGLRLYPEPAKKKK